MFLFDLRKCASIAASVTWHVTIPAIKLSFLIQSLICQKSIKTVRVVRSVFPFAPSSIAYRKWLKASKPFLFFIVKLYLGWYHGRYRTFPNEVFHWVSMLTVFLPSLHRRISKSSNDVKLFLDTFLNVEILLKILVAPPIVQIFSNTGWWE